MTEDFLALTLDVWSIPPESARRVGHPAPFPVELPEQLIRLYTFENDLVLDPFMGSGSSLVAAKQLGRRYAGYDLDPDYIEIARSRVEAARVPTSGPATSDPSEPRTADASGVGAEQPDVATSDDDHGSFQRRATLEGKAAQKLAADLLEEAGFAIVGRNKKIPGTGVTVNFEAADGNGDIWYFDVSGAFTSHRGGLLRTDTVWKSLGRAYALRRNLRADDGDGWQTPLVLLTSHLPKRPSEGDTALRSAGPEAIFDAIEMLAAPDLARLRTYVERGWKDGPIEGFWTERDLP
jgi:site-specific DNA-methyltransferase (adenine-specific)